MATIALFQSRALNNQVVTHVYCPRQDLRTHGAASGRTFAIRAEQTMTISEITAHLSLKTATSKTEP